MSSGRRSHNTAYYSPESASFTAVDAYLNNPPYVEAPVDKPPVPSLMSTMVIDTTGLEQMKFNDDLLGYEATNNHLFITPPTGGFTAQSPTVIQSSVITPSWYFDLTKDSIGKRPVYASRNVETQVPDILMVKDTINPGTFYGDYKCYQPVWSKKCCY